MTSTSRLLRYGLFIVLALAALASAQTPPERFGVRLDILGAIGPATSDYIHRNLNHAAEEGAHLVILRMDTPGGLDLAMRDIIRDILASPVPVVAWVAPNGARAASAGTYILYASHVAAMAPATNLGAATPVQIGGENPLPAPEEPAGDKEKAKEPAPPSGDAMRHKVVNDAVAYIRGLARLRDRNADWAEKAVREAASLESTQALELNVIDLLATDQDELLAKLHGRKIEVLGEERTLDTENLRIEAMAPDWRARLLAVITDPNVAYILMIIGIYGLILEFSNPGTIVAGVVGAICLILALFAFQALPINYAGVGLILLGIALMVGEAFTPSFGALGVGGVVAFTIGSVILIDTDSPGFGIDPALIGAVALASALLFGFLLHLFFRARRRPVVSGAEALVGADAVAMEDFTDTGHVRLRGEIWRARTPSPVHKGQQLRVTRVDGLTVEVKPHTEANGG
ncbi:MAG: nodulation protein NfeD [Gammaproteobacteria bacterium]|nr:nodulation protein NfeD [Gammaproteobacteria bacterium]